MAAPDRRKRKKKVVVKTLVRVFFVLLLLSMLAAYISNQVTISSKRAELDTLNEQIAQQKTENEEMQRILSGDADQITEWVARDSYNYAAPNDEISNFSKSGCCFTKASISSKAVESCALNSIITIRPILSPPLVSFFVLDNIRFIA